MKYRCVLLSGILLAGCDAYEPPADDYTTRIHVTGEALAADGTRATGEVTATLHVAGCAGGPLLSSPASVNPIRHTFEFQKGSYNVPLCVRINSDVSRTATFDDHSTARDNVQANDSGT